MQLVGGVAQTVFTLPAVQPGGGVGVQLLVQLLAGCSAWLTTLLTVSGVVAVKLTVMTVVLLLAGTEATVKLHRVPAVAPAAQLLLAPLLLAKVVPAGTMSYSV